MAKRGGGFPGGMPGNMGNLMKQAQKMQRQMEEASGAEGIMTAYNRINGTVGGMVRENMEISESVIMKQADQKMYENKKSSR